MKIKRLIASLFIVCLLCGIAAGCGQSGKGGKGESGESSASNTGFTENIYDMGGKTITIADSYWLGGESASLERQNCAKVLEEIEKDYNCNIEVFSPSMSTFQQDITTSVAAGKVYANIINAQHEFSDIYRSGNIADVSTIKSLGLKDNAWLDIGTVYNTINGVQYGVAFLEQQCQTLNWNVIAYNKTLAEKYGIEDMYQLVRDGKWTFDKFSEICQQVITKSNGSVQGLINGYQCLHFLIFANDGHPYTVKDGKYTYNCLSDNVLNALQFAQDFNKKGLLDTKDFVGNDFGLTESNVFMSRKAFFHLSDFWVVSEVFSSGMPDDYGILPLPKGPAADKNIGLATNCKSFFFIKGDPDIEDAGAILVAMANRTGLTDEEWVKQQVENSLRDDESGEMLELMLANSRTNHELSCLGTDWNTLQHQVIYDMSLTPRQAMEQGQQGAQASLDSFFGQE